MKALQSGAVWLAIAAWLSTAVGCGPGNGATVTGTVSLNGRPLDCGTVTFHPVEGGPVAYGMIGVDGTYTLQTGARPALDAGTYVATVVATTPAPSDGPDLPGKLLTPVRYGDPKQSGLRCEVKPGRNQLALPLKGP